jgi:hypothetical protein
MPIPGTNSAINHLYFVGFGRIALKIYQVPSLEQSLQEAKVGRLILGKIRIQFNFGLVSCRKEKSAKFVIFGKIPE